MGEVPWTGPGPVQDRGKAWPRFAAFCRVLQSPKLPQCPLLKRSRCPGPSVAILSPFLDLIPLLSPPDVRGRGGGSGARKTASSPWGPGPVQGGLDRSSRPGPIAAPSRRCGPTVGSCCTSGGQRRAPCRIARPPKRHAYLQNTPNPTKCPEYYLSIVLLRPLCTQYSVSS